MVVETSFSLSLDLKKARGKVSCEFLRLDRKRAVIPRKILFYDWDLIELSKLLEYTNDHKLDAPTICMF